MQTPHFFFHYANFFFFKHRPRKNQGRVVPHNFVAFLRSSLAKMAGYGYLDAKLVDLEFWTKMPLKFTAVRFYDKSVVRSHHFKKKTQ